jgi:hypothetical protein
MACTCRGIKSELFLLRLKIEDIVVNLPPSLMIAMEVVLKYFAIAGGQATNSTGEETLFAGIVFEPYRRDFLDPNNCGN